MGWPRATLSPCLGDQAEHQGIAEGIESPHAARDLTHRRAGKCVGMPIGRKALHGREAVAHDLAQYIARLAIPKT